MQQHGWDEKASEAGTERQRHTISLPSSQTPMEAF